MALRKNPKFDLKKNYHRIFEIGIIISLLFAISAFKFMPKYEKNVVIKVTQEEVIKAIDIMATDHPKVPPKPKPTAPILKIDNDFVDIELESTEIDPDAKVEGPKTPPEKDNKIVEESNDEYIFVPSEDQPAPIGGIKSIMEKLTYPEIARKAEIQGRVTIYAYINEKGDVVKAEVVKGIGGGCDEEAVKAVMATKFSPGLQRGKPVKVRVAIPSAFRLN